MVSDLWGARISAATHGAMIAVWAVASLIGINIFTAITAANTTLVGTAHVPTPQAYVINAEWLVWPPAVGFVATLLLTVDLRDRILRKRLHHLRIRVGRAVCTVRCALLRVADQEEEWLRYGTDDAPPPPPTTAAPAAEGSGIVMNPVAALQ